MMKILRKGAILLVIFVAVVAGTSFLMNSQSTDNRSDMNDATLPEVMVKIGSTQANKMYGYRQQMQTDFMRGKYYSAGYNQKKCLLRSTHMLIQ